MKVKIKHFSIDRNSEMDAVNEFLSTIPSENVLDVKYGVITASDGRDDTIYYTVLVVYKQ